MPDSAFQTGVASLRAAGKATSIGYLATGYGQKDPEAVKDEINRYAGWAGSYALDGIFFDEAAKGLDTLNTYTIWAKYVRATTWVSSRSFVVRASLPCAPLL